MPTRTHTSLSRDSVPRLMTAIIGINTVGGTDLVLYTLHDDGMDFVNSVSSFSSAGGIDTVTEWEFSFTSGTLIYELCQGYGSGELATTSTIAFQMDYYSAGASDPTACTMEVDDVTAGDVKFYCLDSQTGDDVVPTDADWLKVTLICPPSFQPYTPV
jgi:hypothetical protein